MYFNTFQDKDDNFKDSRICVGEKFVLVWDKFLIILHTYVLKCIQP